MKKGVVDSQKEGGVLNRVQQSDWTLVPVKNNDEYAVKENIWENQKRSGCIACHDDTRENWPEWSNFLSIF